MDQDDKEALELTQVSLTELGGGLAPANKKVVMPKKMDQLVTSQDSPHKQGQKGGNKMEMEGLKAN